MSEESVLHDESFIEDNLIKCLGVPYYVQTLLAAARVRIINNTVRNNTAWHIAYSFLWIVLVTFSCIVFQLYFYNLFFQKDLILYLSCFIANLMQYCCYVISVLMNRFYQRENNLKIYILLQNIDRILCLEKCNYYSNFQHRWNVLVSIMILFGFFTGYAINASVLGEKPVYTAFFAFGLLAMFMDSLLAAGILYFLAIRVKIFNAMFKSLIEKYKGDTTKKPKAMTLSKRLISFGVPTVQQPKVNLPREKWLECLQQILKSYKTMTKSFSASIFILSLTALIWTFAVIAIAVVGRHSGLYPVPAQITVSLWAGFYYFELFVIAYINDWFIKEIKKMKLLCIRLISYDYDGPYQKTASEIINVIHYDKPVFIVYGMFEVNQRLPLEIIAVVASYSFVLVQFLI